MSAADRQHEHALMQRIAAGDRSAAAELFRQHGDTVYRYLRASGAAHEAAEDLTQEVFLTALARPRSFRGRGSLAGWLLRIARSRTLDEVRRSEASAARERRFATSQREPLSPSEDAVLIETMLRALPPEDREIIVLSRFLELSAAEVGEILGLSAGAVRVRVHRTLQRLTDQYAEVQTS